MFVLNKQKRVFCHKMLEMSIGKQMNGDGK